MAHRTFTDTLGTTWDVWEVRPGRALLGGSFHDQRVGTDRRRAPGSGAPSLPPAGQTERRHGVERRVAVAPPLRRGWLAFQSGDERRRLAPVPSGWERATDAELAAYCVAAEPAPPARYRSA